MRIRYWGVRAVPAPLSLTSIGIGVIVENPETGEILTRFLDQPSTTLRRFGFNNSLDRVVRNFQSTLDSMNTPNRTLELDRNSSTPELLGFLSDHWNNIVTIDSQQHVAMDSPALALDRLYKVLVGIDRKEQKRKTTEVRRRVRTEYDSIKVLREAITDSPQYESNGLTERRMDLAVVAETTVHELNTAFSFDTDNFTSVQDRIEAWTWKIENLRNNGGTLYKDNERIVELSTETPVVASIWPPQNEKQQQLFEASTKKWRELNIEILPIDNISKHAENLALQIA